MKRWTVMVAVALLCASPVAAQYDAAAGGPLPPAAPGELIQAPEGGMELLTNGSFETNGGSGTSVFDGWTVFDVPGSISGLPSTFGSVVAYSGTTTPISASTVEAPTDGTWGAVADSTGGSAKLIYQDFDVPDGGGSIQCDVHVVEQSGAFIVEPTLDWEAVPNQHARLDLMDPGAAPDDVGAGVLENLYITNPGDPAVQSYQTIVGDLTPYAGQTVRIRWAEVDNQFFFAAAIDNCSAIGIEGGSVLEIPTVSTIGLAALAALMLVAAWTLFGRRRVES